MNNAKLNANINEELIRTAFLQGLKIHIALKDRTWRNGYVVTVNDDFFIFKDIKSSVESIFYLQVHDVKPYIEPEEEGQDGIRTDNEHTEDE